MYQWNDSQFDEMSWHDNHVHALRVVEGEFGAGKLIFDLDYILEWIQDDDKYLFKMIPASLTFFEVTDLKIELDYARPTAALGPFSIHEILRRFEKRERYEAILWEMRFNWPDGKITFEAKGFNQVGRGAPITSQDQKLSHTERENVT